MTLRAIYIVAMALALLAGCGGKSYQQQVDEMPVPTARADIDRQCGQVRSEIARQRSLAAINPSPFVVAVASKNVASLENRAALLRCGAAFSASQAVQSNPIEQCIAACKANTLKNADECFTACNH